jgi:sarcosine oxidase subunit beta
MNQQGFLVDLDTGIYQRGDGADVLIGSADPTCDPADVADPDNYNSSLTEQWTQQVYRAALRFPDLAIENSARGTVGLYDVSNDWIPIYDRTDLPGYFVAIGTSGNQFKNAPVIGDIMTRIITAEDPDSVWLTLPNVQREVDLSFYSRLREPQNTKNVMA